MKNSLTSYFTFSKKELNGILVLCFLIALTINLPFVYILFEKEDQYDLDSYRKEVEAFKVSAKAPPRYEGNIGYVEAGELKADYFYFDPNGLPEAGWKRLGFSDRQIRVIKNYESKGGRFYKEEDLKRVYSITPRDYIRIEPFIRIKPVYSAYEKVPDRSHGQTSSRHGSKAQTKEKASVAVLELNSADSIDLVGVRGIGPVFASRIIRYRNRLGGFYSKEQLMEVYGLDSVKYAGLKDLVRVDGSLITGLNLNTASFEQLKRHPYLTFKQMNAIIQYRKQHGLFTTFDDLRKVHLLNEEIIRKIEPYSSF